jgi:acyl CoA:acetate/3-ketoacid CoA transferase alpha subunit
VSDKRTTLDDAVASIESGMTIGIGGWGSRRKPMAFVRALLRTDVTDLAVVAYGGPDIGLLCAADKVKRVYYGFVSLDSPPFTGGGATASVPAHPRRPRERCARVLGR